MAENDFILYCLLVFAFTFLTRYTSCFLFGEVQVALSDLPFHACYFKKTTESRCSKIVTCFSEIITPNQIFYRPFFFYKIVSVFLNYEQFRKYNKYINPFVDALYNTLMYSFFCYVLKKASWEGNVEVVALLSSISYLLSPFLVYFSPRFMCFGTRHFSYCILSIVFIFQVIFLSGGGWMFFILSVLFTTLSLYSAQFTMQASIFIPLVASVLLFRWEPVAIAFIGIILSFLFTPKWTKNFFTKKFHHYRWYAKNIDTNRTIRYIYKLYPKQLLLYGNIFFIVFFLYLFDGNVWGGNAIYKNMFFYMTATVIVSLIIASPYFKLRVFGEAIRYCEYGVVFASFLFCYWCIESNNLLLLFIYLLISMLLYFKIIIAEVDLKINTQTNDVAYTSELLTFLNKQAIKTVLPMPYIGGVSYAIIQATKHNVLTILALDKNSSLLTEKLKNIPWVVKRDLDQIYKEYPFDLIIFDKTQSVTVDDYSLENYQILFENGRYLVYEY